MSAKPKSSQAADRPRAKPVVTLPNRNAPEPDEPHAADSPSRRSEPHIKEVGGSGIALWDESLLSRTMQTLRPPTLRQGETIEQHRTEIAGCAGIAIAAFKPKDAVEAMIAAQAVALHYASLECARRAMVPEQSADVASKLRKDAANSARAMVDMCEALERRRGKGPQVMRIERVVVNEGGQAVVGHVTAGTSALSSPPPQQAIAQSRAGDTTGDALPVISGDIRGERE